MNHKNALYTKDNLIIVVAGKLTDQDAIENTIGELFAHL
jgi:ribosomal protein L18E